MLMPSKLSMHDRAHDAAQQQAVLKRGMLKLHDQDTELRIALQKGKNQLKRQDRAEALAERKQVQQAKTDLSKECEREEEC